MTFINSIVSYLVGFAVEAATHTNGFSASDCVIAAILLLAAIVMNSSLPALIFLGFLLLTLRALVRQE